MMISVKNKASEVERRISAKVRSLAKAAGLSARKLGQKIGLENIYRVLDGERNWSFKHLLAVSELFQVPVEALVGGVIHVPVMASFSALEPPAYPEKLISDKIIEIRGGERVGGLQGLYAMELADRSMMPAFKPGTKFIAEKESFRLIEHEDLVICPDDQGKAHICRIYIMDQQIILKSLNPTVPDIALPRNRLRSCDLIVDIHLK